MDDSIYLLACTLGVTVIFVAGFVLGMLHGERQTLKNVNEKLKNQYHGKVNT